MSSSFLLETKDLAVGYSNKQVLKDINFTVKEGDLICLMGRNGSGKSTILKTLAGLIRPLSGEVILRGKSLTGLTKYEVSLLVSIVLTEKGNIQGLTVEDIVRLGRYPHTNMWGRLEEKDRRIIKESIELLNLEALRSTRAEELSDGQLQKAFIARALAQDTDLIVLDEPSSFLDISSKMELLSILDRISTEKKKALIFSSHDWDLTLEMCPRSFLIDPNGQIKSGAPEEFLFKGEMQNAFLHEKFYLDGETGRFTELRENNREINLKCDHKVVEKWTTHALSKINYKVSKEGSLAVVFTQGDFRVEGGPQFSSLSDLLEYLKLR